MAVWRNLPSHDVGINASRCIVALARKGYIDRARGLMVIGDSLGFLSDLAIAISSPGLTLCPARIGAEIKLIWTWRCLGAEAESLIDHCKTAVLAKAA